MKKTDSFYLQHVLDAIRQIKGYIDGLTEERFQSDRLLQDGVVRQLEIIGEACRNLSEECRAAHPDTPWHEIIGMRNRLIHAYFNISIAIVWEVAVNELNALEDQIKETLERTNSADPKYSLNEKGGKKPE